MGKKNTYISRGEEWEELRASALANGRASIAKPSDQAISKWVK